MRVVERDSVEQDAVLDLAERFYTVRTRLMYVAC
jgi:hypothetical protein